MQTCLIASYRSPGVRLRPRRAAALLVVVQFPIRPKEPTPRRGSPPVDVGDSKDRRLGDRALGVQEVLDLNRVDVLPPDTTTSFNGRPDTSVTLVVEVPQVARVAATITRRSAVSSGLFQYPVFTFAPRFTSALLALEAEPYLPSSPSQPLALTLRQPHVRVWPDLSCPPSTPILPSGPASAPAPAGGNPFAGGA